MTQSVDVKVPSDLVELLSRNAARCEADGVIVDENLTALSEAGMFRLLAPRAFGGLEVPLRQFVEICAELGRGCGSSAWVVSILNSCTWAIWRFPPAVRETVFSRNSSPMICGVVAPTGECLDREDHLEVTGSWTFASGCRHCEWALLGVRNVDETGKDIGRGMALVPMDQLRIEPTWNTVGLFGTGSHTLCADMVAVPRARVIGMDVAASGDVCVETPELYRSTLVPTLALALAGPLVGMALGALDAFRREFTGPRTGGPSTVPVDLLADAVNTIHAAQILAGAAAADTRAWAQNGRVMPPVDQVKVKMDVALVARETRVTVEGLLDLAGARGFSRDSALARYWRDLAVGSRHGLLNQRRVSDEYGRLLLS